MITSFNPENKVQFELYTKLFSDAYKELYGVEGTFDSLDQYFAHIGDLLETANPKYIMIPLDEASEGIFTINANDRTITIPSQFNKCGAVQNDKICEIIVFTIDRYFDYQDLDMTDIYIQWVNAAGEEGITEVTIKDNTMIPGKLRFGWPLTSDITKKDGPVQFAVRFCRKENNSDEKMIYILNTLPATIVVKKGLNISNPVYTEENIFDSFKNVIVNSQNPSYIIPKNPFFVNPGHDITANNYSETEYGAAIKDDNTLTMTAQAVANDLGTISYTWKKKYEDEEGNEHIITLSDNVAGYDVTDPYMIEIEHPEEGDLTRVGCQKYWYKPDPENEPNKFIRFDENEFDKEVQYYIKATKLDIIDSEEEVIGSYYVEAVNTALDTDGNEINKSQVVSSSTLIVPAPADVIIEDENNLRDHIFIEEEGTTVTLKVEPNTDSKGPAINYKWFGTTEEPEEVEDITTEKGTTKELLVGEPGWYSVLISSVLNRKVKTNENNRKICKVTFKPKTPEVTHIYYAALPNNVSKEDIDDLIDGTSLTYSWTEVDPEADKVNINVVNGSFVLMKYDTNLDEADSLQTEELTYQWYVQNDKGEFPLGDSDVGPNGLIHSDYNANSKVLVSRCILDNIAHTYHCVINNKIHEVSAKQPLDTSTVYTFTIA